MRTVSSSVDHVDIVDVVDVVDIVESVVVIFEIVDTLALVTVSSIIGRLVLDGWAVPQPQMDPVWIGVLVFVFGPGGVG